MTSLVLCLALTAVWISRGSGPYPFFRQLELGEGPGTHGVAAAGLTFLAVMVPWIVFAVVMMAMSPIRDQLSAKSLAEARATAHHPELNRIGRDFGIASAGGVIGIMIRRGWFEAWFGDPGSSAVVVMTALLFGVIAGLAHGRTWGARAMYTVAFCAVSLGVLPTVDWYMKIRPEPFTFELLLPLVVGGLPGGLLFVAVRWWIGRAQKSAGR